LDARTAQRDEIKVANLVSLVRQTGNCVAACFAAPASKYDALVHLISDSFRRRKFPSGFFAGDARAWAL
jgi:hypothetical protein